MLLLYLVIVGGSALGLHFGNAGLRSAKRRGRPSKGSPGRARDIYWRGYAQNQVFGATVLMLAFGLIMWGLVLFPNPMTERHRMVSNVLGSVVLVGVGVGVLWWGRNIEVVAEERRGDGREVWWSRRRFAIVFGVWLIVTSCGTILATWPS